MEHIGTAILGALLIGGVSFVLGYRFWAWLDGWMP